MSKNGAKIDAAMTPKGRVALRFVIIILLLLFKNLANYYRDLSPSQSVFLLLGVQGSKQLLVFFDFIGAVPKLV